MSKFFKRINGGLQHRLSQMAKFGESKHAAKKVEREKYKQEHDGSLKGYNPTKVDGIYSIGTMETYRQAADDFAKWLSTNTTIKNASQITREHACRYLRERGALSAWTVGRDMSMINKLFEYNLTRKELGLKDRKKADIKRSRHNCTNDRYIDYDRYARQIDFARACGCRRQMILAVSFRDVELKNNRVVGIRLTEKGGRKRTAPILNDYKDRVTEIVRDALKADPTGKSPLFKEYDKYIDNHSFRADYAAALLHQLEYERANGLPLFGGDFEPERLINLRGADKSDDPKFRNHDRDIVAMVSGALGHNRLRVVFDSYLHRY